MSEEDLLGGGSLLLFDEPVLSFKEPLVVAGHLGFWRVKRHVLQVSTVLSNLQLLRIHKLVLAVHLAHLLNLVQVDNEATFIRVVLFNALTAEDGPVVGAVKVLDALIVPLAEKAVDALFVFEVDIAQNWVTLHDLVEDVEVQR